MMKIQKILLVDDDPNIQLIAQIGLEDTPEWQVVLASSGIEALHKATVEKPDLILMDVMMPGWDGRETFMRIRKEEILFEVPVIFMTAKVQNQEVESYLQIGAVGVITKPFDPLLLSSNIKKILENATNVPVFKKH